MSTKGNFFKTHIYLYVMFTNIFSCTNQIKLLKLTRKLSTDHPTLVSSSFWRNNNAQSQLLVRKYERLKEHNHSWLISVVTSLKFSKNTTPSDYNMTDNNIIAIMVVGFHHENGNQNNKNFTRQMLSRCGVYIFILISKLLYIVTQKYYLVS